VGRRSRGFHGVPGDGGAHHGAGSPRAHALHACTRAHAFCTRARAFYARACARLGCQAARVYRAVPPRRGVRVGSMWGGGMNQTWAVVLVPSMWMVQSLSWMRWWQLSQRRMPLLRSVVPWSRFHQLMWWARVMEG